MKRHAIFFLLLLIAAVLPLRAQTPSFHYFNQKNLADIQGEVQGIGYEEVYGKKAEFLMLTILSDDGRLFRIEVCPQWFFAADIAVGMKIRIQGSLLQTPAGTPYLIAQEISLKGEKIALRDSKGFPLWSGRGRQGNRKGPGGHGKR